MVARADTDDTDDWVGSLSAGVGMRGRGLLYMLISSCITLRTDNVDRPRARVVRPQTSTAESNAEVHSQHYYILFSLH